ncbi:unnamed protein product [Blepharisma stoltei]|uniref:Uncharacterized protein n=1 Tax=Blepharisma stoltei TaxID=1481888 RepID=A0AAU9JME7_9CILI|nr:unnamed protein product [Blepharisma stoltei]
MSKNEKSPLYKISRFDHKSDKDILSDFKLTKSKSLAKIDTNIKDLERSIHRSYFSQNNSPAHSKYCMENLSFYERQYISGPESPRFNSRLKKNPINKSLVMRETEKKLNKLSSLKPPSKFTVSKTIGLTLLDDLKTRKALNSILEKSFRTDSFTYSGQVYAKKINKLPIISSHKPKISKTNEKKVAENNSPKSPNLSYYKSKKEKIYEIFDQTINDFKLKSVFNYDRVDTANVLDKYLIDYNNSWSLEAIKLSKKSGL